MSLESRDEQVLIVGCSHSGVENIILNAKNGNDRKIGLVYSGFHLLPYKREELHKLIDYMKNDLSVRRVAPAHCTGHLGFKLFKEAFGENYLFAGLGENIIIN